MFCYLRYIQQRQDFENSLESYPFRFTSFPAHSLAQVVGESNKEGGEDVDITVSRIGSRAFLRLDGASVEIKDYKISSPMHGCTELEVVFELEGGTTEFSSTAS